MASGWGRSSSSSGSTSLGGAHGVGRVDHVEDRLVGIKSREIYETPAATVLHAAHRALEGLTLSRDTLRFNRFVADELARLVYDGLWFSALSRDLRAYTASSQRVVSGEVRVRLDHGSAVVVGRRSPMSLYDKSLATYDEGDAFDHASAVGFIEIFGLPLRVEAARHGAVGKHHGAAWTWTDPLLADLPDDRRRSGARGGLAGAGAALADPAVLAGTPLGELVPPEADFRVVPTMRNYRGSAKRRPRAARRAHTPGPRSRTHPVDDGRSIKQNDFERARPSSHARWFRLVRTTRSRG